MSSGPDHPTHAMGTASLTTGWVLLVAAGLLEACWAVGLKYTGGFSRLLPSVLVVLAMAASVLLLSLAMRSLPASTAYAAWTGLGVAGATVLGVVVLGERLTTTQTVFLLLLLLATVGLQLTGNR
jgi:quaternary ammonium compound-resistance protein SugE